MVAHHKQMSSHARQQCYKVGIGQVFVCAKSRIEGASGLLNDNEPKYREVRIPFALFEVKKNIVCGHYQSA